MFGFMWDCISWGLILVGGFQLGRLVVKYITNMYKTELYEKLIKIIDQPKENYEVSKVHRNEGLYLYSIKYKSGIELKVSVNAICSVQNIYIGDIEVPKDVGNLYIWEIIIIENKLKDIIKEYINKCKESETTVRTAKVMDHINNYLKDK